jgi:hypothetical protein
MQDGANTRMRMGNEEVMSIATGVQTNALVNEITLNVRNMNLPESAIP